MKNIRSDWTRRYELAPHEARDVDGGANLNYPLDGRETVYPPYEQFMPTRTVGEYLAALAATADTDAKLPDDYADYLAQRVPSLRQMLVAPKEVRIDKYGKLVQEE